MYGTLAFHRLPIADHCVDRTHSNSYDTQKGGRRISGASLKENGSLHSTTASPESLQIRINLPVLECLNIRNAASSAGIWEKMLFVFIKINEVIEETAFSSLSLLTLFPFCSYLLTTMLRYLFDATQRPMIEGIPRPHAIKSFVENQRIGSKARSWTFLLGMRQDVQS